jgi:hypothetical protein
MKAITLFCLLAAFTLGRTQAQNIVYDENAVVRNVEAFKGIEVSGSITVYLSQGTAQAVAVSADDAQNVGKVKTEVKNGVLKISPDAGAWNGWNWRNRKLKAYITVTDLESIDVHGASSLRLAGDFAINTLRIDISGASSFKGMLKGKTVKLEASGASSLELSGSLDVLSMEVSGASSVKAFSLTVANCSIDASGASAVSITATSALKMEASGASSIGYKGTAAIKSVESSGASSIKKRD